MLWWRFTSAADCDAAQAAATAMLPPDKMVDGDVATHQVTARWAIPTALTDGTVAIPAYPAMALPAGAVEATADDIAALMLPADDI